MIIANSRRWLLLAAAIFMLFAATGIAALHLAAQLLRTSVEQALGPEIRFDSLRVGLTNLEITGVEVRAPQGWPAITSFSARRVVVVPDLRDLASGQVVIGRVTFEHAYVSAVRPKENGSMRILPGILDQPGIDFRGILATSRPSHGAVIGKIELRDCTIDLYDSTGARSKKVRIELVNGVLENVAVPALTEATLQHLNGLITDADRRAKVASTKSRNVAHADSAIGPMVRNVDRPSIRPYY